MLPSTLCILIGINGPVGFHSYECIIPDSAKTTWTHDTKVVTLENWEQFDIGKGLIDKIYAYDNKLFWAGGIKYYSEKTKRYNVKI